MYVLRVRYDSCERLDSLQLKLKIFFSRVATQLIMKSVPGMFDVVRKCLFNFFNMFLFSSWKFLVFGGFNSRSRVFFNCFSMCGFRSWIRKGRGGVFARTGRDRWWCSSDSKRWIISLGWRFSWFGWSYSNRWIISLGWRFSWFRWSNSNSNRWIISMGWMFSCCNCCSSSLGWRFRWWN